MSSRKLVLSEIADSRAYERERAEFRQHIIDLKAKRRVALGTFVTVVFENRDTIRFQIQEMARAEGLRTDDAIQEELDVYNPLIPDPGQLRATLFIELTSDEGMREWLPKLVGIERSVAIVLPDGERVPCRVEAQHERQLTRDHVTAAVHYVEFELSAAQVAKFGDGAVLSIDHPAYQEQVVLSASTVAELRADLAAP